MLFNVHWVHTASAAVISWANTRGSPSVRRRFTWCQWPLQWKSLISLFPSSGYHLLNTTSLLEVKLHQIHPLCIALNSVKCAGMEKKVTVCFFMILKKYSWVCKCVSVWVCVCVCVCVFCARQQGWQLGRYWWQLASGSDDCWPPSGGWWWL